MKHKKSKLLIRLHQLLPEGLLADAAWLNAAGYSSSVRSRYVTSGWLQPITRGVFRRPQYRPGIEDVTAPLLWQHVVVSLQLILKQPIVVGGRTVLELDGLDHNASAGLTEIHLYGEQRAPNWLCRLPFETSFVFHNAQKLFREEPMINAFENLETAMAGDQPSQLATIHGSLTWIHFGNEDWPIVISTRERAILEVIDEIPNRGTFHQADVLMEGLVSISPRRMNRLLSECRSIKVRRLFLWFADRHRHAWVEQINRSEVDLGSGDWILFKGGNIDKKYHITIPEDFDDHG